MTEVSDCHLPESLYYLVEHHVWARPEPQEVPGETLEPQLVVVGVTDVFQALAERMMFFTPRRVGRVAKRGGPLAVVESGKWLGIVPSPVNGEIVAYNEAVSEEPALLNSDPYGSGWVARVSVREWAVEQAGLVTGEHGIAYYRRYLEAEGIQCMPRSESVV
jgi:glycine cleavage system H protein